MNNQYDVLILKYSNEFRILPEFVKGIIDKESSFKSLVRGDDFRSVKGTRKFKPPDGRFCSYGLGQANWCSGTAQAFWKVSSYKELFNPEIAIAGIARYFRYQLDRYGGSYQKAVSAYNAGSYTKKNTDYVTAVFGNAAKYASDFSHKNSGTLDINSGLFSESGNVESSPIVFIALGAAALVLLISFLKD